MRHAVLVFYIPTTNDFVIPMNQCFPCKKKFGDPLMGVPRATSVSQLIFLCKFFLYLIHLLLLYIGFSAGLYIVFVEERHIHPKYMIVHI